ncbi:MAG TPA: 50S ribosomal protein L29 [Acidimicrobiia bacterium]
MSLSDLREMTEAELLDALVEAKEERFNLRFQIATNQLDNTARLKTVKKEIAQILTILRERAASAEAEAVAVANATAPGSDVEETA